MVDSFHESLPVLVDDLPGFAVPNEDRRTWAQLSRSHCSAVGVNCDRCTVVSVLVKNYLSIFLNIM